MVPGGAREVRGLQPAAAPNDRLHDFDLDRHAPRRCAAARAHTLRWGWLQRQVPHLKAIGLDDYHFHGLRHSTGAALAHAGASDAEIQAILMHKTRQMTERYTKGAQQRRLAYSGMAQLEKDRG
jgi:integrase